MTSFIQAAANTLAVTFTRLTKVKFCPAHSNP